MLAIRVLSFTNSAGRNASRLCWTRFQQRFMSSPATALYSSKLILTPSELATLKAGKDSNVVPIDVSWFMPNVERDAQAEFLIRRIPTARRMDLDVVASEHPLGLKHMMPSGAVFAEACETIGVSPSSHVVLYDSIGVFSSPRALFMFKAFGHLKASILNGGLPRWELEGYPISSGPSPPVEPTSYPEPTLNGEFVRSYEQIVENASAPPDSAEVVLDARSKGRFTGQDPEPRPSLSSGHIPQSRSLPFSDILQPQDSPNGPYTIFPPVETFRPVLENALGPHLNPVLTAQRKVTNTCGSGMTAAVLWLALQELGVDSAIYDESWTGYACRPESRIVKDTPKL